MSDTATTNRLIHSTSPYLLQHAQNPIDWYPWGEEAIERARKEDKPIFVSIGYSTCYWCHVMEREVFCNEDIGALMNSCFINIKVDREERPDIDELYMTARQTLTRQGGWPNNLILTPDLKPFWAAGTMSADNRYGPSFTEVAVWLADSWKNKRDQIERSAEELTHYLELQLTEKQPPSAKLSSDALSKSLYERLEHYADKQHGGFFSAPKFPHETYLLFLLNYYRQHNTAPALNIVTKTLNAIAAGGIHDHLGGGFHRYAVDAEWQVPHFEKMLYNQAMLGRCYAEAYAVTHNPYYRHVAEMNYACATEIFTSTDGGFYSALDAETDATEGAYYVWTASEIRTALFQEEAELFFSCYELADVPEFAGHKHPEGGVITAANPAILHKLPTSLLKALRKLKDIRSKRQLPMLDTKVIASWHGMMLDSFAVAGKLLENKDYIAIAEKAADFTRQSLLMKDGRLRRIAGKDNPLPGFLEDYAHTIQGLLSLYDATNAAKHLTLATQLTEKCAALFEDTAHGGFFFTEASSETLVRIKTADDNAQPSANAVMLRNLGRLATITGDRSWIAKGERLFAAFSAEIERSPVSYASLIDAYSQLTGRVSVTIGCISSPIQINQPFTVSITLHIPENWHITPGSLSLHFKHPAINVLQVCLPSVTQGNIPITAEIQLIDLFPTGKEETVTAIINYQACDERSCQPPAQIPAQCILTVK
jgi:uncharacterized protein